jgi:hypothetical protein
MIVKQISVPYLDRLPGAAAELGTMLPDIVFAFGHTRFFEASHLETLKERWFPSAHLIGCSTAGEICEAGVSTGTLAFTAVRFDKPIQTRIGWTEIHNGDTEAAARRLAAELSGPGLSPELSNVLVFAPGIDVDASSFIRELKAKLGERVCITGGLAGDGDIFRRSYCLGNHRVSDRGVVALGFYGSGIVVRHGCYGGWQPFGVVRRVTKRQGNLLLELDGQPALEVYRRYLGVLAQNLPAAGLQFPFAIVNDRHQEGGLIRSIIGIDEDRGGLIFAGDIPSDCHLRLMQADADALIHGAKLAAEGAAGSSAPHPALALLVSCVGRRLVMASRVDEEVEAVATVFGRHTALAGFYSFGEISPLLTSADCCLHNQTMTITTLAEG